MRLSRGKIIALSSLLIIGNFAVARAQEVGMSAFNYNTQTTQRPGTVLPTIYRDASTGEQLPSDAGRGKPIDNPEMRDMEEGAREQIERVKSIENDPHLDQETRNSLADMKNDLSKVIDGSQRLRQFIGNTPILQGIPGIDTIAGVTSAIDSIQSLGTMDMLRNIPGMEKVAETFGNLGNISSGINRLGEALRVPALQNFSPLKDAFSALDRAKAGFLGKSFDGAPYAGGESPAAYAASQVTQKLKAFRDATKNVSSATNAQGFAGIKDVASTLSTDGAKALAKAPGAVGQLITGGGACIPSPKTPPIGKIGVPVTEQIGPLLISTKITSDLSLVICNQLQTIKRIETEIHTKLFQQDPAERKRAAEIISESRKKWYEEKKKRQTGSASGQDADPAVYDTVESHQQRAVEEAAVVAYSDVKKGIEANKNLSTENKKWVGKALEMELDALKNQRAAAQTSFTSPVAPTNYSKDPYNNILHAVYDNPATAKLNAQEYIGQKVRGAVANKNLEIAAGGGTPNQVACAEGAKIKQKVNGKEISVCPPEAKKLINLGRPLTETAVAFDTSGVRQAELADTVQEAAPAQAEIKEMQNDLEKMKQESQGRKSSAATFTDILKALGTACQIKPNLPICPGSRPWKRDDGGRENNSDFIETETEKPGLDLTLEERGGSNFTDSSVMKWEARGTDSCEATNDWVGYGDGDSPTTTPKILVVKGTQMGLSGETEIFHPALFRASISADEGNANANNMRPSDQREKIKTSFGTNFQTSVYIPDTRGAEIDDVFTLTVNGKSISTSGNLPEISARGIVGALKTARANLSSGDDRNTEFGLVELGGTDTLEIKRVGQNMNIVPLEYGMKCGGFSRSVKITF